MRYVSAEPAADHSAIWHAAAKFLVLFNRQTFAGERAKGALDQVWQISFP